jgi:ParB/RepB/Spo0J family partition protein
MKLEIEYIPIDELTPYENNAKIHTPEQIDQIKKSIAEFGMNDPIAVWREKNLIIEGHGRLTACKELGMTEVPIIRLDDLTDEQRRAYTLVHNQTTMNTRI